MNSLPYIPGKLGETSFPLARFLPPLEDGVCAGWLVERAFPGAWVLDPFGISPQQALRSARDGARILVAVNNPITRFLLEMVADPPAESDYKAALAALAASRKGDERLETHLKKLYETECANCQKTIMADAFLWRKDANMPFARVYTCPHCGDAGERLTTVADAERALAVLVSTKLHRARVLERVAPLNDLDREYAEEALRSYLPRALYALTTLINRLDGLSLSLPRQRALEALLLTVCDAANTLYPYPVDRPRPKQLIVPGQFYEHNLWKTLEEGIALWTDQATPTPLTLFPEFPPESGGICLFEGKLKDLVESDQMPKIDLVLTAIPRPNQAFWTLSALWAGWLWGHEAAEPFKVGLRRRRYDWAWHTNALQAAFRHLGALLPPKTPVFALLAEPEPSFLSATLIAAAPAFQLKNIAMRTKHDPVQIFWVREDAFPLQAKNKPMDVENALQEYLLARGEATTYLHLHAQALTEFARARSLLLPQEPVDEALNRVHAATELALKQSPKLIRYEGSEKSLQVGLWGLVSYADAETPLADRVEIAVVRYLSRHPQRTLLEIESEIYPQFTGLLTPPKALVAAILDSYGSFENGTWSLRLEDSPSARRTDLDELRELLISLGERLGYPTQRINEKTLLWGAEEQPVYVFSLIASALVNELLNEKKWTGKQHLIVIPGGRAGLLAYKKKRDPALRAAAQEQHFIKFRLLRSLGALPLITKETWDEQIGSDPIEGRSTSQMMMF